MLHARDDYNRIQDPAGRIGDDEPVFLLRAKDKAAPAALRCWADLHKAGGGDPLMSRKAYEHADLMEDWQAANGCKTADL